MDNLKVLGGLIALGAMAVVGLLFLILLFERAGPEEQDARPSVQPVQQQVEQWPQKRQIDDQEMRLRKLERDFWDRENERRMESLKFSGDK